MISVKKVRGRSMEPDLKDGDYIVVLSVFLNNIRVGHWIIIDHPHYGRMVKQVCEINPQGYRVRGLSEHSTDTLSLGLIRKEMIVGKVLFRISGL